jgi:murein L,D-transpeptidase YcbB/YkuD
LLLFYLLLVGLCLLAPVGLQAASGAAQQGGAATCPANQLSDLCQLIEAGHLKGMRWPNFSDYRQDLREFYQPVNYDFAWTKNGDPTPQARAVIHLLQNSDDKGLRIEDYDSHLWDARIAGLLLPTQRPSPNDLARFDLALTVSTMRYVSALRAGRINPRHLQLGPDIEKKRYRLAEFIRARVVEAQNVNSVMEQVEPSYPGYRRMRIAFLHYLALAREGEGDPLPPFKKRVKPGDIYTGARQLTQLLQRLGDLQPSVSRPNAPRPADADTYSGAVVEGVKHFQQRHGLPVTGTIDRTTFTQLNTPLSRRLFQLQLALERMRWLPADLPGRLIAVNIPEFQLRAYDDYRTSLTMKVIVGKAFPERQTPIFQDEMEFLIFHPHWNVPASITKKELIPAIKKTPGYLEKHDFEVVDRRGGVVDANITGDTLLASLRSRDLEIRQKPGPGNSLGSIKFVFPNNYDVYLHGTPEQALFSHASRAFSHGCIRVEDPATLAAWVLHDNPAWTSERIQATLNAPGQIRVSLAKPIPVLVLYSTAVAEENGEVRFVQDIYGQDAKLERALENGYPYPR